MVLGMSGHAMWQERVKAWRRSGQTAPMFSQRKGFTPSALRYGAGRLETSRRRADDEGTSRGVLRRSRELRRAATKHTDLEVDRKGAKGSTNILRTRAGLALQTLSRPYAASRLSNPRKT